MEKNHIEKAIQVASKAQYYADKYGEILGEVAISMNKLEELVQEIDCDMEFGLLNAINKILDHFYKQRTYFQQWADEQKNDPSE